MSKIFIPNNIKPKKNNRIVRVIPEIEGFRRLDKKLQQISDNPNIGKWRDERKERLCPVCSNYSAHMVIVPSVMYGKTLETLRDKFKYDMPFTVGKAVVCCKDCAELVAKIDKQKGYYNGNE